MIQHSQRSSRIATLTLFGLLAGLGACADEDAKATPQAPVPPQGTVPTQQGNEPATAAARPLVIVTERKSTESSVHYLHVVPSWPSTGELDYGKAFELGSPGVTYVQDGAIFFYHAEVGEIEKFTVDKDLKVSRAGVISFIRHGIKGYAPEPIWVSPEVAYLLDEESGKIARWNPRTLRIDAVEPLRQDVLERNGMKTQFQLGIAATGRLFTTVNWRNWATNSFHPATVLGVFDQNKPAEGPLLVESDRCAASVAIGAFTYGDGYIYAVGDGAKGFDQLANPNPSKSKAPQCVVRMREDGTQFDPDFFVDLQAVTKSPAIYMAYPMVDQKLLVSMWTPDVNFMTIADPKNAGWFWEAPAYYEHAIIDLKTKTSTKVAGLPRAAVLSQKSLMVDNQNFVQLYRSDRGSSLHRVDPNGTATQVLNNPAAADVQYIGRL